MVAYLVVLTVVCLDENSVDLSDWWVGMMVDLLEWRVEKTVDQWVSMMVVQMVVKLDQIDNQIRHMIHQQDL